MPWLWDAPVAARKVLKRWELTSCVGRRQGVSGRAAAL
jgi:hypothetical protein